MVGIVSDNRFNKEEPSAENIIIALGAIKPKLESLRKQDLSRWNSFSDLTNQLVFISPKETFGGISDFISFIDDLDAERIPGDFIKPEKFGSFINACNAFLDEYESKEVDRSTVGASAKAETLLDMSTLSDSIPELSENTPENIITLLFSVQILLEPYRKMPMFPTNIQKALWAPGVFGLRGFLGFPYATDIWDGIFPVHIVEWIEKKQEDIKNETSIPLSDQSYSSILRSVELFHKSTQQDPSDIDEHIEGDSISKENVAFALEGVIDTLTHLGLDTKISSFNSNAYGDGVHDAEIFYEGLDQFQDLMNWGASPGAHILNNIILKPGTTIKDFIDYIRNSMMSENEHVNTLCYRPGFNNLIEFGKKLQMAVLNHHENYIIDGVDRLENTRDNFGRVLLYIHNKLSSLSNFDNLIERFGPLENNVALTNFLSFIPFEGECNTLTPESLCHAIGQKTSTLDDKYEYEDEDRAYNLFLLVSQGFLKLINIAKGGNEVERDGDASWSDERGTCYDCDGGK